MHIPPSVAVCVASFYEFMTFLIHCISGDEAVVRMDMTV